MNWNDLVVLLEVSRAGTMTGAARRLRVNQTTVSRRIAALEQAFGRPLVVRTADGAVLTDDGDSVVRAAAVMETTANELSRELLGRESGPVGHLRVTVTDAIALNHPQLFASFATQYPGVELAVDSSSVPRSLSRREADIAIRWTLKPPADLFGRKLTRVEYALFGAKTLTQRDSFEIADLPWVAFTIESGAKLTEQWMREHVPEADVVCRYTSPIAHHAAIKAGVGVGFLPCAFGDSDDSLVRLRPVEAGFGYDLWILTHPDLSRTERVRMFIRHAGDYFDARRDLFAGIET